MEKLTNQDTTREHSMLLTAAVLLKISEKHTRKTILPEKDKI